MRGIMLCTNNDKNDAEKKGTEFLYSIFISIWLVLYLYYSHGYAQIIIPYECSVDNVKWLR